MIYFFNIFSFDNKSDTINYVSKLLLKKKRTAEYLVTIYKNIKK